MRTVSTVQELRAVIRQQRERGLRIGFVPTMGNLHEGHMTLIQDARRQTDYVVTSIFVNPLQFGPKEDLDRYPRTLANDQSLLEAAGNNLVFTPTTDELYPAGLAAHTRVSVPHLTSNHCGNSRPGHFDGVTTVVNILLNAVQPDIAFFGEKDFQQLAVIRKMVTDLMMPIGIIGIATARGEDGLALSSRNGYLSASERQSAPQLYTTLKQTAAQIEAGERDFRALETQLASRLNAQGFRVDYANIAHADSLAHATADDTDVVILVAAFLGTTRLIDNIRLSLSQATD